VERVEVLVERVEVLVERVEVLVERVELLVERVDPDELSRLTVVVRPVSSVVLTVVWVVPFLSTRVLTEVLG
jgi:hypothetical protein